MNSHTADVVVVGAGIIGASIAWRLAKCGMRVAICEAGRWGGQASWAGAGMLVPGSEFRNPSPAREFARRSLALYPDFVAALEEESGLDVEFSVCGSFEIVAWDAEGHQPIRGLGWVEAQSLQSAVPGLAADFAGAYFDPAEGQADPRTILAALRVACERRGVTILEQTPVCRIDAARGGALVCSNAAEVAAHYAVLAAGAWSTGIPIEGSPLLSPAFPVKGHLVGFRLPAGSIRHILRLGHTYVVQRRSGYTIAGSSEEDAGFDQTVDPSIVDDIGRRARRLVPGLLKDVEGEPWTGLRPACEAGQPQIRRLGDSALWLAYGHYRNGILLAPATADDVSAAIIASWETD